MTFKSIYFSFLFLFFLTQLVSASNVDEEEGFFNIETLCHGHLEFKNGPLWKEWSNSSNQNRFQPEEVSKINLNNSSKLKVKWVFGVPNTGRIRSQPSIAGGVIFFGSETGIVYALDSLTGCTWWTYKAMAEVRNAIAVDLDSNDLPTNLYFGDFEGRIYRLNAKTGEQVWVSRVNDHRATTITGSISIYGDDIFIPLSSVEILKAIAPKYECCTFRGGVVAMNKFSGEIKWKFNTVEVPKHTGFNVVNAKKWGPSGVPVWSTPTVDERRNRIYIGTGQNYSPPATKFSDSILAINIQNGQLIWSMQSDSDDIWNASCVRDKINCDFPIGSNFDFGAAPVLVSHKEKNDLLLAGQKSGMLFALDPRDGSTVWKKRIGKGGEHGGVHWSMSSDGELIFVPVGDIGNHPKAIGKRRSGIHAYKIGNGELVWSHNAVEKCSEKTYECYSGFSAAISATNEIVFAGNLNGTFYAISTNDGKQVWKYNTREKFSTVNFVPARGGTIDASGPVISSRMVYINSGYGGYGKLPGNALIAFGLDD